MNDMAAIRDYVIDELFLTWFEIPALKESNTII